jgi:hypothetical protein
MTPNYLRGLAQAMDEHRTGMRPILTPGDLEAAATVLREVASAKVIKVDIDDGASFYCPCEDGDSGHCLAEGPEKKLECRSPYDGPSSSDCPLRTGRVIIQAKKG